MACVAYKLAFPKMDSLPTIRAAISCIGQGITLEVFDGRDKSQLLYAAQVALSVLKQKGEKKSCPPYPIDAQSQSARTKKSSPCAAQPATASTPCIVSSAHSAAHRACKHPSGH
jgi:hypothetical protein